MKEVVIKKRRNDGLSPGNILTYEQLKKIQEGENDENLVSLDESIICSYNRFDMLPITGEKIYVRKTVADKLLYIQKILQEKNKNYFLKVLYGYRHPSIQEKYFNEMKGVLRLQHRGISEEMLNSIVHNYIAVPDVAGHPTGGAVDLTITTREGNIDMGSDSEDYTDQEKMQTFSKKISKEAQKNRILLHDLMRSIEFAPFYGEWWHFSYGDREWACFYDKEKSLYNFKDFTISKK
ncbi:MAG: D-alanyl-D-alanine carboxypeptidase family protein [Candidatus Moraniibacteriota bacterium]|nr:MAG: D-alanyl-D-alanine carboxypeptidase family protein [Candidatus Moranbacteria bacterium]